MRARFRVRVRVKDRVRVGVIFTGWGEVPAINTMEGYRKISFQKVCFFVFQ